MYAMLMKKIILSNDIVIYNPIKAMKGTYNKEDDEFIDDLDNCYYEANDVIFIQSDEEFCFAYPMTEKDLLFRYGSNNLHESLVSYQDDVFASFNFAVNLTGSKFDLYQLDYTELKELLTEPELNNGYYNGYVKIPKKKLYMLTQLDEEEKLRKFINEITVKFKELDDKVSKNKTLVDNQQNNDKDNFLKTKEEIFIQLSKEEKPNNKIRKDIDTEGLESYLKERIIGQDRQIENLVTVISENYKTTDPHLIQRPLLMGPSGVGKTETLKLLAEYLQIPFTRYSTPTLSGSGYVGKNIEDILKLAYKNSSNNVNLCNESLIFLDEFDKIAERGRDVSDEAVQNLLLNFLDGTIYDVEVSYGRTIRLDTTLMNIVMGGAFVDILKDKNKKLGFSSSNVKDELKVTDKDIIDYGFIPEIVGRCNPKIMYNNLTKDDLKKILLKGKLSPILLKQQFYKEIYDVSLKCDDSYVDEVLNISLDNGTGARELKQIVYNSLLDVSHTLQNKSNQNKFSEVVIDKEILADNKVYTLRKR